VTGTLAGGTFARGDAVVIQPAASPTRIRHIQSHSRDVETSGPGTRTALKLADVDAVEDISRGDIVTLAQFGDANDVIDVLLGNLVPIHAPD
jgi:selenocysteine-specific translation elongation factor